MENNMDQKRPFSTLHKRSSASDSKVSLIPTVCGLAPHFLKIDYMWLDKRENEITEKDDIISLAGLKTQQSATQDTVDR